MNSSEEGLQRLIFGIDSPGKFNAAALAIFRRQAAENAVYSEYLHLLKKNASAVTTILEIPFMPVSFFKKHKIISGAHEAQVVFESSGTTEQAPSFHYVADKAICVKSFIKCFELFYGSPSQYCILALLPSYLERKNSSLVFMADSLMNISNHPMNGFFLHNHAELHDRLKTLEEQREKTLLLGVSFALLDFAEKYPVRLNHTIVMETGGMKGRRKEITRSELHALLQAAFDVPNIHSEYGMTELLSQAYSSAKGIFRAPPWMKILIRNPYDPFDITSQESSGAVSIIDLANIHSCSFIHTDDVGKLYADGTFEITGRMDHSETRGCNLMADQL